MGRLDGKVGIVTGAATGLGREVALLYGEQGAKVVVADIREEEGESTARDVCAAGGEATFVRTDVSRSEDVRALIDTTEATYGAVHVMTANAGILGRGTNKSLVDISEDEIDEIMDVNWRGVCLSFKYAIPAIRRAGGGAMTTTTSVAAHRGRPKLPAYCASKGAIVALVRSLALDLAPDIRVNAVSAGSMQTEIGAHVAEALGVERDQVKSGGWRAEGFRRSHPREVAHAHLFLASDEGSFVTGQALLVDGGRSVGTP